jgi:putative IMPACT (imprinted ancient) family translation regulator
LRSSANSNSNERALPHVAGRGEAAFAERGSRFLGHINPVESVAAAEAFVTAIEDEFPDATHNVPAYRVRTDPLREYASDDGTVEQRPQERLRLVVGYDDSGIVRGILESADAAFEASYEERATFAVRVPSADAEELRERLLSATSGRAELESGDSQ